MKININISREIRANKSIALSAIIVPNNLSTGIFSFLFSALVFPIILKLNKHENIFSKVFKDAKMIFWVGGSISFIIYVIVVWGFTKAPIPLVAALRETSIFFSIFIGYFFLKETINLKKIISIVLIVIGVVGIKLF